MLERIARFVIRHRILTLVVTACFVALSAAMLVRGGRLTSGTFRDVEATRARVLVEKATGRTDDVTFIAIFQPARAGIDLPKAMHEALSGLALDPRVSSVVTPEEAPPFIAREMVSAKTDGLRVAYITLRGDFPTALAAYPDLRARITSPEVVVTCTGQVPFMHDMNKTLESDLMRAELIALPLALLVLLLVFRTAVAALLPIAVGGLAVLGALGITLALSHVFDVAMYTVNVCSLIGLGVSIDYSLFLVSRYREELAAGLSYDDALTRAVATAGRTVAFSGLVVCTGLFGLFFFSGSYLVAMGAGGAIVVALAVVFALTFLPALLSLLGPRIHAGKIPLFGSRKPDGQFWARLARGVMKRPIVVALPTLCVLLAMGHPFLHVRLAAADVRVLDHQVEARRGQELLKAELPDLVANRILVAVAFPSGPTLTPERIVALVDLTRRIERMPHVSSVESAFSGPPSASSSEIAAGIANPAPSVAPSLAAALALSVGDGVVTLHVSDDSEPDSEEAQSLVTALRADRRVGDGALVVGGDTAHNLDATAFIRARAPYAVGFVVSVTFLLLLLVFRSVLLPVKAVLMNFLSMCGSFGALVWIFQDGHLGVREPRPLEPTLPALLFCVLFGLSMDYEILLLSRIKESYDRTGDNTESVAEGLQKTAGLITSAAAIMVAVFTAFAFAHVVMIQAMGVGMALAVALDATLVRTLLVPSTMRLLGKLNWWAPGRGRRTPTPPMLVDHPEAGE